MIRRGLNVWRVYLDLFSNFLGMVVLGGAGLMLIVGGAVASADAGGATFPIKCRGGQKVSTDPFLAGGNPDRNTCTWSMPPGPVRFEAGHADGADEQVRAAVCQKLYFMVQRIKTDRLDGARVEIVGSASEEYLDTQACRASKYWPGSSEAELRANADPEADRFLCNAPLAAARAVATFNLCLSGTLGPSRPESPSSSDMLRYVTIAAEPTTSARDKVCAPETSPGCDRTVFARLRLQNNSARAKGAG